MTKEKIVILENVTKIYRTDHVETHALRGIDLEIEEGEFTAIAGPSGSGKTTLLNIIGGLDSPTTGNVIVAGKDITNMSASELADFRLKNLGFVFQSYNLIEVLTAYENTEFVLMLQGISPKERRERVMRLLHEVGIGELADRRPTQLSGGQQQRVAVARAIVGKPRIVLADEPTANLDSDTSVNLLNIMLELNRNYGVTFIFSTHDPLVMKMARRLIKLRDGKIVSDETVEEHG